jgi:hypothetical protein
MRNLKFGAFGLSSPFTTEGASGAARQSGKPNEK